LQMLYNGDGTVAKTTNGAGNATVYAYDPLARLISVTDPLAGCGKTARYKHELSSLALHVVWFNRLFRLEVAV